ncbi:hypothetical protein L1887_09253 [Cichorium endivia]|nr:hypothetical protein L1887_09253 [Cichorium endivia]
MRIDALYVDDLENLLDDFMLSLNTEIDDGSIEEIAESLMIIHEECLESNFASIERLRKSASQITNHRIQVVNGDEDDSDSASSSGDESMEVTDGVDQSSNMANLTLGEPVRAPAPIVDADGWTVVSSRRNRAIEACCRANSPLHRFAG